MAVSKRHGFYNQYAVQERAAAAVGIDLLRQAAREVPLDGEGAVAIADYGSAEGRNSLAPLGAVLDELGRRSDRPVAVVHTDLPGNDFSSLFELVASDPGSYQRAGVFTFAAGRSFYEQIFPAATITLGWSATSVLWLRAAPSGLGGHLFSLEATGPDAEKWSAEAAQDWEAFLGHRSVELRPGGQVVVSTLIADRSLLPWMEIVDAGAMKAVEAGVLGRDELERMVVPTYLRTMAEMADPIGRDGSGLELLDQQVTTAADPAFTAFDEHRDAQRYGHEAAVAMRAWAEPSFAVALTSTDEAARHETLDGLFEHIAGALARQPQRCDWRVALLRIGRRR